MQSTGHEQLLLCTSQSAQFPCPPPPLHFFISWIGPRRFHMLLTMGDLPRDSVHGWDTSTHLLVHWSWEDLNNPCEITTGSNHTESGRPVDNS